MPTTKTKRKRKPVHKLSSNDNHRTEFWIEIDIQIVANIVKTECKDEAATDTVKSIKIKDKSAWPNGLIALIHNISQIKQLQYHLVQLG